MRRRQCQTETDENRQNLPAGRGTHRPDPVWSARQISSGTPFCRINAAFHLATERRIYAAAKNSVVRPYFDQVASAGFADAKWLTRCVRLLRSRLSARSIASPRRALGRTLVVVDPPDLPGEGDDISIVPDELERGRLVQTLHDHGKGAVPVDLGERAGVRHRKIQQFSIRVERAEREGVKGATEAKLQVKHPGDVGGYLRSGGRFRPE